MHIAITRLAAIVLMALPLLSGAHAASYPKEKPRHVDWSFAGPFGTYDPAQLQRGLQVYREVCAACHSLGFVPFRTLGSETGPHLSEAAIRALAAEYIIADPTAEEGERPGRASDVFPEAPPAPGEPPDLSVIAKAIAIERGFPTFVFDVFTLYQETGPNYIYSLLTGYKSDLPDDLGGYENPYFVGGPTLSMAPPLFDGFVSYAQNLDENPANDVPETVDQYAKDVAAFLMWTAEPHMTERKAMGLTVIVFLILLAGLVYYTKKKVWADVH